MHINYAANQLSSSGVIRITAWCQLNLYSLFVGVKMFSQLTHLCYPAGCNTVPSLPGRDTAQSWPGLLSRSARHGRHVRPAKTPALHHTRVPSWKISQASPEHRLGTLSWEDVPGGRDRPTTWLAMCFFTGNGRHRPVRAVGVLWRTNAQP